VRVEWHGHSFIVVESPEGVRVAVDPHDGASLNLPVHRVEADHVLITHDHFDHNAVEVVSGYRGVFKWRTGVFSAGGLRVEGLPSFHDKSGGELRGPNTIYVIEVEGVRVAHLGDLGHPLTSELVEKLRGVEILVVPVGGTYTIDAYEAREVVERISPRLVIPVHYWVPGSTLPLDPLDRFLTLAKARRLRVDSTVLELDPGDLPEKTTVVVFDYARL